MNIAVLPPSEPDAAHRRHTANTALGLLQVLARAGRPVLRRARREAFATALLVAVAVSASACRSRVERGQEDPSRPPQALGTPEEHAAEGDPEAAASRPDAPGAAPPGTTRSEEDSPAAIAKAPGETPAPGASPSEAGDRLAPLGRGPDTLGSDRLGPDTLRAPRAQPDLVDLLDMDSTFVLDIRYATSRNFTGKRLYPVARCLLRADAAERLARVHARLRQEGFRLRIFDCYRPLSIQRKLWALVPDERYVANPAEGSRHNRAAAVDLTLADSTGAELPMPTEYDDFTHRAHRDWQGATPEQLANRRRLEEAMTQEGFEPLPTEWWHFDAPDWKEHAILDVPLAAVEVRRS